MKLSIDTPKFERDIFPSELKEIAKRRQSLGLREPEGTAKPSVKNGLIGPALSGGGYIGACLSSMLNRKGASEMCFENLHGSADPLTRICAAAMPTFLPSAKDIAAANTPAITRPGSPKSR